MSKVTKKKSTSRQGQLRFALNNKPSNITCPDCEMSYSQITETTKHEQYHGRYLKGRIWSESWGHIIEKLPNNERIVKIDPTKKREVNSAIEMFDIVNRELNAPADNTFWMNNRGKVFVYISRGHAVGVISIEYITKGAWMKIDDCEVVNNVEVPLLVGISRIWVSKDHRRQGVAMRLLKAVQEHSIYGITVPKLKIGWSQPSTLGSKVATKFNGVKHKSGRLLVPCYVESTQRDGGLDTTEQDEP